MTDTNNGLPDLLSNQLIKCTVCGEELELSLGQCTNCKAVKIECPECSEVHFRPMPDPWQELSNMYALMSKMDERITDLVLNEPTANILKELFDKMEDLEGLVDYKLEEVEAWATMSDVDWLKMKIQDSGSFDGNYKKFFENRVVAKYVRELASQRYIKNQNSGELKKIEKSLRQAAYKIIDDEEYEATKKSKKNASKITIAK